MRCLSIVAAILVGAMSCAIGDVVHLRGGGTVEGQAARRGKFVEVRTANGTLRYPLSAVDRIEWGAVTSPASTAPSGKTAEAEPKSSAPQASPVMSWQERVQQEFSRTVTLDFTDTPLPDVVAFLQNLTNLNFVLDTKNIGDPSEIQITLQVHDLPLQYALEWILKMANLKYALRKGVIFISDPETIQGELERRLYDVKDLLLVIQDKPGGETQLGGGSTGGSGGGFGSGGGGLSGGMSLGGSGGSSSGSDTTDEMDFDERGAGIVQLILRTVKPDTWGDAFVVGTGGDNEGDQGTNFF